MKFVVILFFFLQSKLCNYIHTIFCFGLGILKPFSLPLNALNLLHINVAMVFAFIYLHCVKQGLIRKAELMKAFVNFAKFITKMIYSIFLTPIL